MPLDRRLQSLLRRANRALPGPDLERAIAVIRSVIGPSHMPAGGNLAAVALDKLRRQIAPDPEELAALELVIRQMRPMPLSVNGQLEDLPAGPGANVYPETLRQAWTQFRIRIAPYLYSIGRIELVDGECAGTGFLVGPDLVATNRHVAGTLSSGAESLSPGKARILFRHEAGAPDDPRLTAAILGVAAIHPRLDLALLRIPTQDRPPVPFGRTMLRAGDGIVAIGYPTQDSGRNPLFLETLLQGRYGVKRAAVGEILSMERPAIFHDCSTTSGNSGSPLFSLRTGLLAGVHRGGFFLFRNEGIDGLALAAWIRRQPAGGGYSRSRSGGSRRA